MTAKSENTAWQKAKQQQNGINKKVNRRKTNNIWPRTKTEQQQQEQKQRERFESGKKG